MALTLTEWDQAVAPHLHRIEDIAQRIAYMAAGVRMSVMQLPSRPDWATKAEQNIDEAIKHLTETEKNIHMAKHHLIQAKEAYKEKPVEE